VTVHNASATAVGELAARHGIALNELVARQASLEDAFMELTHDAVDHRPCQPHPEKVAQA
jgi:ABC-2 type transport system ATP-binding protein